MSLSWPGLIDSPINDLHVLARDPSLEPDLSHYAKALSFFLQGDRDRLNNLAGIVSGYEHVDTLVVLRSKIRTRSVTATDLHEQSQRELDGVLEAEKHFCLGMGWEQLDNNRMCSRHFAQAAALYRSLGCPRKALRSFYNAVAAESRENPHKNYVSEYQAVIQASQELGDAAFEGMALTMLAREYQITGLFNQSMIMSNRALFLLAPERGTLHYGHALLQKAHVLLDLKRDGEIEPLLLEAEMSPFNEVQAAVKLLRAAVNPEILWMREWEKDLLPTWRNRVPKLTTRSRIGLKAADGGSELEERLLKLIYNGPVEKWDLIGRLYPGGGSALALENRLKNLLGRVRKKYPQEIVCQDGRYSLAKMPGGLI